MISTRKISTRKNRIASSCTALALCFPVLALCLIPRVGLAQDSAHKKSAQASEPTVEPFFYQELTREALGDIKNLDAQNVAEGRVAPDGHLIITGANTEAYVPPGKFIQFLPPFDSPDFKAVSWRVFDNNQPTEQAGGLEMVEQKPIIVRQPNSGPSRRVIHVVAYDGQGHARTVMQCVLRSRVANPNIADIAFKTNKEQCSFNIKDNLTLTARHLYLGDICLGRMADNTGQIDMDERRLAPGNYTCQLIAKDENGVLIPGPSSSFAVSRRYDIMPENAGGKIVIPETNLDAKLEFTVKHQPDVDIVKTQVYVAGIAACGQEGMEGDNFKIAMPLLNVPTGPTSIEVIGIASDGTRYPVENIVVDLDNGAWRARIHNTVEWQAAQDKQAQIKILDAEMHDWLKQAEFEPAIIKTKTVYTLRSITDHFATGKKAQYMGNAARCLTKMAQLQLEAAQLYKKVQMLIPAKNLFYTVVQELGRDNINGETAQNALNNLTKMQ